jgi:predicted regulator of Ras-like GTPase activity (Roadblock/LC7/MglB family)
VSSLDQIDPQTLKLIVQKFGSREGVYGTLICDKDGLPLQSDMASADAEALAAHVASLMGKVHGVAEEIGRGELSFVNITLQEAEILIAPESDFTLVVLKKLLKKGGARPKP